MSTGNETPSRREVNRSARGMAARVALFGSSTVISGLTAVVAIPITVRYAGVDVWADAAVGMSVGAIVATIVSLGWPITGISAAASLAETDRGIFFASSVSSRTLLMLPGIVAAAVVAMLLAPNSALIAVLAALTLALQGLNSNWYFVGANDPVGILLCDALVRAGVLGIAAITIMLTSNPVVFFTIQLVGGVLSIACAFVRVGTQTHRNPLGKLGIRAGIQASRNQVHGSVTATVATLYQSLPLIVVSALAPSVTGVYAISDRLLKLSNTAGQPFIQVIQGWIPASSQNLDRRIVKGCSIALGLGVVSGSLLFGLGPGASALLTDNKAVASFALMLPIGIALAATLFSQCLGVASLVPLGGISAVSRSAIAGACIAAVGLVVLVPVYGANGAAWSVAISEVLVVAYQAIALGLRLRARSAGRKGAAS
ncbi:O-antigen/teichoic acid export membrane protein [Curtobacterium sp. PhB137]|uniref:lipopolysaccharide biosynthesis protein n=1 Tax=Curtobacterium sp. PhB137 TaxID=2485182 RepID=UPI000F9634CD|nr:hypothetical protein [Curtobacterium sp. PhB137]RPE85240.1 O-antigen/teichoic acid export membrane protein [Curtobacterium sp. PhB137]